MPSVRQRAFFGYDGRLRRRRRSLLLVVLAAAVVVALVPVAELLALSSWADITAAALALTALAVAARSIVLLDRVDRARLAAVEETVDLMGATVMVIGSRAEVLLANPAACETFGRAEGELLGRTIQDFFADGERAASRAAFVAILDGRVDPRGHHSVREVVRPDGSSRFVSWHVAPRVDGRKRVESLLISGQDVTTSHRERVALAQERSDIDVLLALARDVAGRDDARGAVLGATRELTAASWAALATRPSGSDDESWALLSVSSGGQHEHRMSWTGDGVLARAVAGERSLLRDPGEVAGESSLARLSGASALLVVPVGSAGAVVGVLLIGWQHGVERLAPRLGQLVGVAASEAATALRRMSTLEHLESAALTDALTAMPNRRAFDGVLERAIAQARRSRTELSLLVLDLNAFKELNDRQGHAAGDERLVACARAWKAILRGGDLLARLGGDEFAVIAPGLSGQAVDALIARLKQATPHPAGAAIGAGGWSGEDAEGLYRIADRALYRDKAQQRTSRLEDPERLAAVQRTGLWDAGSDPELDALVGELGSRLSAAVYVTLVGSERLVYAGKPTDEPGGGRLLDHAHCQRVVSSGHLVVVSGRPPTGGLAPANYAGAPLTDVAGRVLGALCACSDQQRAWTADELELLERCAHQAEAHLARRSSQGASVGPTP